MSCADFIRRQEWALAKAASELSKDHSLDEMARALGYSKSMLNRMVLAVDDLKEVQKEAGVWIDENVDLTKIAVLHKVIAAGSLKDYSRYVLKKRQMRLNMYLLNYNSNQVRNDVANFMRK